MKYDDYSFDELIDVFIQIDDRLYLERALAILSQIAIKLDVTISKIQLEQIVSIPTESSMRRHRGGFFTSPSDFIDEVYTKDGLEVRDKLIRLKEHLSS